MTFEYKKMDESDRALYASWNIHEPISSYVRGWTVDKENDIYMVCFGGQGDHPDSDNYPPTYFLLRYKGLNVFFEGRSRMETLVEEERWAINWDFVMTVPTSLQKVTSQLPITMAEALLCKDEAQFPNSKGQMEIRVIANSVKFVA